ncbi:unnamed protein product [Cochlearia groenlandica]
METKSSKIFFLTFSIILVCLLAHVTFTTTSSPPSLCNGSVAAECSGVEETVVIMEPWRLMAEQQHTLSYGALRRNQPACEGGNRGESYSNKCLPPPSNPYSRGCSKHYRCRGDS